MPCEAFGARLEWQQSHERNAFAEGTSLKSLGLTGAEIVSIVGLAGNDLQPRQILEADIAMADGRTVKVPLTCRIDTFDELEYFRHGGILHYVLRQLAG
jgi:aconitate hydratase